MVPPERAVQFPPCVLLATTVFRSTTPTLPTARAPPDPAAELLLKVTLSSVGLPPYTTIAPPLWAALLPLKVLLTIFSFAPAHQIAPPSAPVPPVTWLLSNVLFRMVRSAMPQLVAMAGPNASPDIGSMGSKEPVQFVTRTRFSVSEPWQGVMQLLKDPTPAVSAIVTSLMTTTALLSLRIVWPVVPLILRLRAPGPL